MCSPDTKPGLKLAGGGAAVAVLLVVAIAALLWRQPMPPTLASVSPARVAAEGVLTLDGHRCGEPERSALTKPGTDVPEADPQGPDRTAHRASRGVEG
jgi:hypothetical protein